MNKPVLVLMLGVLSVLAFWLQGEVLRGTFDPVERVFVSWLAANARKIVELPALTLVLYDDESSELSGSRKMAVLDGALFARAASHVGAVAVGIEGLPDNAGRMIEAAGKTPVFGGYALQSPPSSGWTPLTGPVGAGWRDIPGLAGPATARFTRGFVSTPSGVAGPRSILLVGRNGDHAVASFLALAWTASQRSRLSEVTVGFGGLRSPNQNLPLDSRGEARFFPDFSPLIMTMSDLFVASEKFEREGGSPPLRGRLVVLVPATSDMPRLRAQEGETAVTPSELWAQSWEAIRHGSLFILPGTWYTTVLACISFLLSIGPSRRRSATTLMAGIFSVLVYLLVALGIFVSLGILLPFAPSVLSLVAGLALGRIADASGWLAAKQSPS
ncbi:MAG: hypothetical protein WCI38_02400 [Chthoniobacterales bacterium]